MLSMIFENDQQQQQQLPNISRICGAWGDPDVHNLTPMRTSHVKRSFPTDPHKTFLKKNYFKNLILQKVTNNENAQIKRNSYLVNLESSGYLRTIFIEIQCNHLPEC